MGVLLFLSVKVDNCSFSDHLNEYFTDSVSIYMVTSPTLNSFRGVSCGSHKLILQCFLIFARADGEVSGISGSADTMAHPQQGS